MLLAIPNLYPSWAPLQLLALVPVFYLGSSRKVNCHHGMLIAGLYMGLAYIIPQLFVLRLPILMSLILLVHLTVLLILVSWVSAQLLQDRGIVGSFAVGAFLVVLDWVNITAVPIWGTAQSFVRCWSSYPGLIQFTSFTGMAGIIFALGTLQALAVNIIIRQKQRIRLFVAGGAVLLVFLSTNTVVRFQRPLGRLKVAAVGWTSEDVSQFGDTYSKKGFDALFAQPVMEAVRKGARLIVSPEMGFYCGRNDREKWLEQIREIARRHKVFLVIGYFNEAEQENRLLFMNEQGTVVSEYSKTYLTPFEDYRKGDGQLKIVDFESIRIGGMICQDDNFTRLSREYGRKRVGVVAVPTLDWYQVRGAHLQNSIHRAIESRYAIVRAATDGISAIITPTGKILDSRDHFIEGPGAVVGEVPVYMCRTLFSVAGSWPAVVSMVFLAVYIAKNLAAALSKKQVFVQLFRRREE